MDFLLAIDEQMMSKTLINTGRIENWKLAFQYLKHGIDSMGKGQAFVDVGSNVGLYALLAASKGHKDSLAISDG